MTECQIQNKIRFTIIGSAGISALPDEKICHPEHNALYCLANGLRHENNKIKMNCIDVEKTTKVETIYNAISSRSDDFMTAYRNEARLIPQLVLLETEDKKHYEIKDDNVYVILGGLGSLGLQCGLYLSSRANVKIVLVGRSSFPKRERWDDILKNSTAESVREKIQKIKEMEERGSNVLIYRADAADYTGLNTVFQEVSEQYHQIEGVFHLAGVAGDGFIYNKNREQIKNVIHPKIGGICCLDKLYDRYQFGFVAAFSSVSAVIAEAGQSDYSAANGFYIWKK